MITRFVLILFCSAALSGCATSATERAFGDSVRSVVAEQRMAPEPREPELSTDGERLENVMQQYRTWVGDPLPVVRQRPVEAQ